MKIACTEKKIGMPSCFHRIRHYGPFASAVRIQNFGSPATAKILTVAQITASDLSPQ
jgi:hypothetical protein